MSTISQFLKHLEPYFSLKISSKISMTYVEVGFEASNALSVPKYILPISLGSRLLDLIRFNNAFAAKEAVSSSQSGIDILFKPRPFFNFS